MIKKFLLPLFLLFLIIIIPLGIYLTDVSSVSANKEKIAYNLPYPGILPDHPLYFLKIVRDRTTDFLTRDSLKKAELHLLYSDKRAAMAIQLFQKGKDKLAVDTLAKGEKYFLKIPPVLKQAKKQGAGPASESIEKLKLSNAKHAEIIDSFLKEMPQGRTGYLTEIKKINGEVKKQLESL